MVGRPMEVAIALGLWVSVVASPTYGNRCLAFSEISAWVKLDRSTSLDEKELEKVRETMNAPWDYNADFEGATEKIL